MAIRERVENSTKPLTTKMAEEIMIWNTRHVVAWFAKLAGLLLPFHDFIFDLCQKFVRELSLQINHTK
jgi:hypothetical protein